MTKAKARERAKAKASEKAKKRATNADQAAPNIQSGQFNPKDVPNSTPGAKANIKNFGGARRGAARSR
jgi:hypothetical protein